MPDGRFLNKRVSYSEQLGRVSLAADLLFMKCIAHLDVAGRITGNPVLLKALVVPLRAEITAETIPGLISELESACGHEGDPLVRSYEVNAQAVVEFPGFARQQKGLKADREAASKLPALPPTQDKVRSRSGVTRRKSGVGPESKSGVNPSYAGLDPPNISLKRIEGEATPADQVRSSGGWPARLASIFGAHIGTVEPGECGRWLAEAVELHGEEAVLRATEAWAIQAPLTEKPQFLTPKSFARQVGAWVQRTTPMPVYDERGEPTPEAARLLGRGG